MIGSVKEGPNHYEILGLTPSATSDDIEKAFAARMKMRITNPEKAEDPLKLRAAYKALHDPFWRRIYDSEQGFAPVSRPKPTPSDPPQSGTEERVAPFIAAALRQPAVQAEHPTSPDFILLDGSRGAESTIEERPEPSIAEIDYPTEDEAPVPDTPGRRSDWNRTGAAAGFAVVGLGLVSLLFGIWGNFDRSPETVRAPTSARVEQSASRSGVLAQTRPQQAAPIQEETPSIPSGSAVAPVQPGGADPAAINNSIMDRSAQAQAADSGAETPNAERQESSTIASPTDPLAPVPAPSSTPGNSPTAPPATIAQSPPAAAPQAVTSVSAVPSAPVVNRAAAPRWISGGLVKGDNPHGRYRGTVTVQFTVQPNGRVSGCRAAISSGSTALDARTCQLVEQRLRFRPALNWQGRAIPYETRAIYTWGVKHRSLLDQLLKPGRP